VPPRDQHVGAHGQAFASGQIGEQSAVVADAQSRAAQRRAGEVARAFALTREVPRIPFTTSLASLAVDRIFDAIVLLADAITARLARGGSRS
jgi:hypothetical protein